MKREEVVKIAKEKGIKNIASKNMNKLLEEIERIDSEINLPKITETNYESFLNFFKNYKRIKLIYIKDNCNYDNDVLKKFEYVFFFKNKNGCYKLDYFAKFENNSVEIGSNFNIVDEIPNEDDNDKIHYPNEEEENEVIKVKINKKSISCDLFTIFILNKGQSINSIDNLIKLNFFKNMKDKESETLSDESDDISDYQSDEIEVIESDEGDGISLGSEDDIEYSDDSDESYREGDDIYSGDETFSFQSDTDEEELEG